MDPPRSKAVNSARERGANLVEFAILAPLLFALLFGIIDFGWILAQHQEVRHGAREGARLAAVNAETAANITTTVQNAMNMAGPGTVTFVDGSNGCIGSIGTVIVTVPVGSLTGFSTLPFMSSLYPTSFTSSVDFFLDQNSTLWGAATCP